MSLIAGERLTAEVVTVAQTGQCGGGCGGGNFFAQHALEPLDYEFLHRGASPRRGDLNAFKDGVGQVNGGLHVAINTALWPYFKD